MRKRILLFLMATGCMGHPDTSSSESNAQGHLLKTADIQKVFICTGNYSKKYHLQKNCKGLNNCKGEIEEVTLEQAKKLRRTLCGWED